MRLGLLLLPLILLTAGQPFNPAQKAAELERERSRLVSEALKAGKSAEIEKIEADVAAKAAALVKDVRVDGVTPGEAYGWAQLFKVAKMHLDERKLLESFLGSKPAASMEFQARLQHMLASVALDDGAAVDSMMMQTRAPSPATGSTLCSYMGGTFHYYIRDAKGPEGAIEALEHCIKQVPRDKFENDEARKSAGWARRQYIDAKASYLVELGRAEEAVKLLQEGLDTLDDDVYRKAELGSAKKRYELIGKASPAMPSTQSHGEYQGIERYRGKVLILDFTAHWCHACIKSLPSLRRLYDEQKENGLEILSVTTFYGHFGAERSATKDMPKREEFERMPAWMEQHRINWPMVYVERTAFQSFGVAGIPQIVLIDKQGVIRNIDLGFSDAKFRRFEAEVKKLLAEPG